MTHTISLKTLRPMLPKVVRNVCETMDRYVITRRGEPVLMLIAPEDFEGMVETIDILSDPAAMKSLKRGLKDMEEGRVYPFDLEKAKRLLEKAPARASMNSATAVRVKRVSA